MKKWKSTVNVLLFNFGAVLIGLVISALLLYFMKVNPAAIIGQTLGKIFGDKYNMGEILVKATPLIFTSLAFAFTFKANLFNIGAQGQFYMFYCSGGHFAGAGRRAAHDRDHPAGTGGLLCRRRRGGLLHRICQGKIRRQ